MPPFLGSYLETSAMWPLGSPWYSGTKRRTTPTASAVVTAMAALARARWRVRALALRGRKPSNARWAGSSDSG
eukprot:1529574-Prymnesium_polylepis.1